MGPSTTKGPRPISYHDLQENNLIGKDDQFRVTTLTVHLINSTVHVFSRGLMKCKIFRLDFIKVATISHISDSDNTYLGSLGIYSE